MQGERKKQEFIVYNAQTFSFNLNQGTLLFNRCIREIKLKSEIMSLRNANTWNIPENKSKK
jgi:hypothetical protein